jgi:hypothetical protein
MFVYSSDLHRLQRMPVYVEMKWLLPIVLRTNVQLTVYLTALSIRVCRSCPGYFPADVTLRNATLSLIRGNGLWFLFVRPE